MKHVALSLSKWSLQALYDALFNYCFPIDFKVCLHAHFECTSQGWNNIQDFLCELEDLASHFPEVTDFQIMQIFCRGLHQYIHLYLIEKGLNPECTTLKKLVKYAVRHKEAYETVHYEKHMFKGQVPGCTWGHFVNRTAGPAPYEPRQSQQREPIHNGVPHARPSKPPSQPPKSNNGSVNGHRDPLKNGAGNKDIHQHDAKPNNGGHHKLTKEKLAELQADNKCFSCKGIGHQSHNCPEQHKAKAPVTLHISTSSIHFANLETLASRTCEADAALHLNATHVGIADRGSESLTSDDDEFSSCCESFVRDNETASTMSLPSQSDTWSWPDLLDAEHVTGSDNNSNMLGGSTSTKYGVCPGEWPTRTHLEDAVQQLLATFISMHNLQEALDAGINPYLRFKCYAEGDSIEVTNTVCDCPDWHFLYQFSVIRNQLDNLDWGTLDIIQTEWNTWCDVPTLEEWGSGFPATRVSDRYHPARYWLQVHLNMLLEWDYSDVPELQGHILVEPHALGYHILSKLDGETYLIMHDNIHKLDFQLHNGLAAILGVYSLEELHYKLQAHMRCRWRRLTLMICTTCLGNSHPKGLKFPWKPEKDIVSAVE